MVGRRGLGLHIGRQPTSAPAFSPASLFANGEKGLIWDFSVAGSVFQDAGTTPGAIDSPIGRIVDQSPNGNNGNQATGGAKPSWKTSSGRFYALLDGSDDFLATSSIDFSGTDKVTVLAGIRKLSDAGRSILCELSADINTNSGTFAIEAPDSNAAPTYRVRSKGTAMATISTSSYAAPTSNVVTLAASIVGDDLDIRVNGSQVATSASDQGAGNYGNYVLYFGRRGGSSLPFNGQLFSLIIVGRACTADEITATENWINARTGAY